MSRRLIFGFAAAGMLALAVTQPLLSLVQPPDEQEMSHDEMMAMWMQMNAPGEHQAHLKKLEGTFTTVNTMWPEPGAEPVVSKGTATNRMILDGRYLESEYEGEFDGQPFSGRGLTGYNNMTGKYGNIWVDSMSTGLTVAEGHCSNDGSVFTYSGEMDLGPQMGKMAFREVLTIVDKDTHKFEWFDIVEGKEIKSMEIIYKRKK